MSISVSMCVFACVCVRHSGVLKRVGSVVLVGVGLVAGTVTMTLALLTRRALHR